MDPYWIALVSGTVGVLVTLILVRWFAHVRQSEAFYTKNRRERAALEARKRERWQDEEVEAQRPPPPTPPRVQPRLPRPTSLSPSGQFFSRVYSRTTVNGRVVEPTEMTPEQRAELDRSMEELNRSMGELGRIQQGMMAPLDEAMRHLRQSLFDPTVNPMTTERSEVFEVTTAREQAPTRPDTRPPPKTSKSPAPEPTPDRFDRILRDD